MFRNRALLENGKDADEPIGVYLSGGANYYSTDGTLKNVGEVYLHENELANILSYAKVKEKQKITYDDARDIFTVHTPYKRIHLQRSKRGL